MVVPRARLLPESFLLGVITIPRAHGLPGVKLLEANTFLEAFLPGILLLLGAYGFLESTPKSTDLPARSVFRLLVSVQICRFSAHSYMFAASHHSLNPSEVQCPTSVVCRKPH